MGRQYPQRGYSGHLYMVILKSKHMFRKLFMLGVLPVFVACSGNQEKEQAAGAATGTYDVTGRKVIVYTTADSTGDRLALKDTLEFKDKAQPFENEITVFVDPGKTFQTCFGTGAALTDASAETFYKLPKD